MWGGSVPKKIRRSVLVAGLIVGFMLGSLIAVVMDIPFGLKYISVLLLSMILCYGVATLLCFMLLEIEALVRSLRYEEGCGDFEV